MRVNGPKYPVIVYLHGGEYKVGSKYIKYPEQLVDSQTIVVSINYRLGIFGKMMNSVIFILLPAVFINCPGGTPY